MLTSLRADAGGDAVAGLAESLFSHIDFSNGALVAISGGSDSTALLLLLKAYLDRNAPQTPLLAVTVDHGLRAGSAAEARTVASLCATLGIVHRTMVWSDPKPASGIPAAAREARYRLLATAARQAGIGLIVTAHTADDQAETVLMRQARSEEPATAYGRGLAGMAPATLYDWRTWIVRPLLSVGRETLRSFLRGRCIGWIDDPTNSDQHYERPRIRADLHRSRGPHRIADLLALAETAAAARSDRSCRAAALIRDCATRPVPGLIRLDPAFPQSERDAAVTALRLLLATAGGTAFPPDEARTAALLDKIATPPLCATLSRTVVDARRSGIFLHRERRDLPAPLGAVDGMVWDGRYRIALQEGAGSVSVEPAGDVAPESPTMGESTAPASLIAPARAAEPAFRLSTTATASPVVAPFDRFLPSFDLDLADVLAGLVGARALPRLPFNTRKTPTNA
ncbi:MAG: tRNA lysidine(34) synthetase TilS [Mesorhizobium sp.]